MDLKDSERYVSVISADVEKVRISRDLLIHIADLHIHSGKHNLKPLSS